MIAVGAWKHSWLCKLSIQMTLAVVFNLFIDNVEYVETAPRWQGGSRVQSFDLDGVDSISAIPPTQITCFVDHFNKLE
jgi:hypothetical protein